MLPWRAIPVTLAHWREPQIISSPSLCLPPAHSPPPGFPSSCAPGFFFFFPFHSFMFFSLPPSLHTQPNLRRDYFFFFSISLFLTFLSLLMFFIIILSCFLLYLGSVFIFPLPLVPFSRVRLTFQRPPKKEEKKRKTFRPYLF